jgi:uncharacterized integral membrane protein
MDEPHTPEIHTAKKTRHVWPWFVLAGVILGILLAIFWMSKEVARTRQNREMNINPSL